MIKRVSLFFLLLAVAVTAANTAPRVSRATLVAMEKSFDSRVSRLWDDNPYLLLGTTRGVYLDGYGAIFTTEVSLVLSPTSLMHPTMSKDEVTRYHLKKMERIPQLKKALRDAMMETAASLDTVPADEQIVMVVFIPRNPSEDVNTPVQITAQAKKKSLLDAQRANGAGLDQAIKWTEN
jgi:hypothetical protein